MPVVTSFSPEVKLPYQCPLHPVRDVHGRKEENCDNFLVCYCDWSVVINPVSSLVDIDNPFPSDRVELAKLNYRVNLWTCSQCGKSFTGEHELEHHIHQRHPHLSEPEDFSICLADYCDILRCDPQKDRVIRRPWPVRQTDNVVASSHQVYIRVSEECPRWM